MNEDTMKIIRNIVSYSSINSVLELGPGNSTGIIRSCLENKNRGFCLSLENDPFYYNKLINEMPDSKFGSVNLSEISWDMGLNYNKKLDGTFDMVFIDGPGMIKGKIAKKFISFIKKQLKVMRPDMRRGTQSLFILDWLVRQDVLHKDTIICVDSRTAAVYHYMITQSAAFNFFGYGSPISPRRSLSSSLSHDELSKYPNVKSVTLISSKQSNIVTEILGECEQYDTRIFE